MKSPLQIEAEALLDEVLAENSVRVCITCSFQAEDMVVLDMLRDRVPDVPVLFLDTGYHFRETYAYRDRMSAAWKLNLVNLVPRLTPAEQENAFGLLYRTDSTRCCQLRKVVPLMVALESFDLWFTGLRREQSPSRRNLQLVEQHHLPSGRSVRKVSLLAGWAWADVRDAMANRRIDYLPLYEQGYSSIGCEPCTAIPLDANDPRSGRWAGQKLECGIHTFSKRAE
jgi:phosphoadenosine phosphosulfate reductase